MDEAERQAIEHACMRLMTSYCIAADHDDCERFLSVFAEDGYWAPATGEPKRGHAELRAFFEARPGNRTSRHLSTNPLVDVIDAERASGVSYALVFRSESRDEAPPAPVDAMTSLVEYQDEFRRTSAGWKIQSRTSRTVFRR